MGTTDSGAGIPVFAPDLRSIVAGLVAMVGFGSAAVAAVGLAASIPLLLVSGLVGGGITGWLAVDASRVFRTSNAVLVGGVHAAIAAGAGGAIVYLYVLTSSQGLSDVIASGGGGVHLLLVGSPLAVVFFGLEGVVGGAVGSAARVAIPAG